MATKGYTILFFPHDPENASREEKCRVCGCRMTVQMGIMCSTGFASSMAGLKTNNDVFVCPDKDLDWHKKAERLHMEMERTESKSLKAMLLKDIKELLDKRRLS